MTFVLIDGVIANATFATGATAGTSSLVDGINNQAFAAGRSATAQPVDAILGLTTWPGVSGAAGSLAWTSQNSTIAITESSSDSLMIGWTTQNSTIAIATNLKNNYTLAWTSGNSVVALSGTLTNGGSIGWTSADSTILINVNVASAVDNIALSWTDQSSTIALAGNLLDGASLSWISQNSTVALAGSLANNLAVNWGSSDDSINLVAISDVVTTPVKLIIGGPKGHTTKEVRKTKEEIQQELWDLLFPVEHIAIVPTQQVKQIIDKISKRNYKSVMARNNAAVHETQKIIKKLQDEEDEELMFLL